MKDSSPLRPKSRRMAGLLIALLIIALGAMWLIKACSHPHSDGSTSISPSGADTIDVAIEYSPLTFYQRADTIGGFDYDLLRALASEGDLKLKFHPFSSISSALDGLRDGLFDLVVADAPTTADERNDYAVSEPAYLDRQVLVQRADTATLIASPLGLAGKKVWVPQRSPAAARLRSLSEEIGDTIIVVTDSLYGSEQLFILTATGEIDRAVVNERIARAMAAEYPDVDISTAVSFTQFQSWLMRRNDKKLAARIDTLLVRYKATPAYSMLHLRYFGED
ncbi:MAG: transporter substrate-binding domain-containing protein [Pseudoflavonifractor sp.]|nr:transporter substrate-binding domain-containing protein [Alloprevotella sp.]MCM1116363.1 transporter substrate-binding domain-containing protein [Pseudoflavonifractor sp.]